jgi:beta-glucosidase
MQAVIRPRTATARDSSRRRALTAVIVAALACGVWAAAGAGASSAVATKVIPVAAASSRDPGTRHQHHRARSARSRGRLPADPAISSCSWLVRAVARHASPSALARLVLSKMNLAEELGVVDLYAGNGYENTNLGAAHLCIPPLTLQDGPNGLAAGDTGVTQLPASLGIAASFDPGLAYDYGRVLGAEAHAQGIDVVQGPNLGIDRVPEAGRAFEGYGEDPYVVSVMGDADIEGIQSEGVMADAKHFAVYTQETDRKYLDQVVSRRALAEIYLRGFQSAVEQAHVASIMCAYGKVNGTYACQDPHLLHLLGRRWGFRGFVRSDLGAVPDPIAAFAAGIDAIKPAATTQLRDAWFAGRIERYRIDRSVFRILRAMFAYGIVTHPPSGHAHTVVATPAHASFALRAAERTMVLLKDGAGALPLRRPHVVAVIGADAGRDAMSAGHGSSYVIAPFLSTPIAALRAALGRQTSVRVANGASANVPLPAIPAADLSGAPHDEPVDPPFVARRGAHVTRLGVLEHLVDIGAAGTGSFSSADLRYLAHFDVRLTVARTGLYSFSTTDYGDTWISLDGHSLLAEPGEHGRATWTVATELEAGRHYALHVTWFPLDGRLPPRIGMADDTPAINRAVRVARGASTAIVFVNDWNSEGFDRPSLALPGDENALVAAVARANRRTVVVLNTGGPVLLPFRHAVAAILEAWYPGEQDGTATAAVLTGRYDPSGRLPVTFYASQSQVSAHTTAEWPGIDGTVHLAEGLDVGYRYVDAHHLTPTYPFGYGISYTRFDLSDFAVSTTPGGTAWQASVRVTNTGRRAGAEVVEAYLQFPTTAGEPPLQLKAWSRAELGPGRSTTVTLTLPDSAFAAYLGNRWRSVGGFYTLHVGTSSADLPFAVNLTAPT